jgi:magnesium transporter
MATSSEMSLTPAGDTRDARLPRSYFVDGAGVFRQDLPITELARVVQRREGALWVEIDVGSRPQVAVLEKVFGFHPLSIEDALSPNSRVKLEEYDDYLFMIIRGVRFYEATRDPYDLETFNLGFFIGQSFLVTVHAGQSASASIIADRLSRNPELLQRGPDRLAHAIMDIAVDAYFPILDQIDEFVDGLEDRIFNNFDRNALHDIFAVKRLVLSLRRHLAPQREVLNVLTNRPCALLTPDVQLYYRDVYDHMLRIVDALDTYRDLLSSTLDSYLTQVSNRLGQVTKGLTVVATLSVPFVMVSGMWGMNFEKVPLSHHPYGFAIMLVLQLVAGVALLAFLRWRKLI